jgi:hypothetical protein
MNSSKTMTIVRQVYDCVESALWAALLAFVIYFLIHFVPSLPEAARRAESIRTLRIAAETSALCEEWGMKQGTHEHTLCTMDLRKFRKKIEQEFADDGSIL